MKIKYFILIRSLLIITVQIKKTTHFKKEKQKQMNIFKTWKQF